MRTQMNPGNITQSQASQTQEEKTLTENVYVASKIKSDTSGKWVIGVSG